MPHPRALAAFAVLALAPAALAHNWPAGDLTATLGPLDDANEHPGFAREPNAAALVVTNGLNGNLGLLSEAFPFDTHGAGPNPDAEFHGWYNTYAHATPSAYGDLLALRVAGAPGVGACGTWPHLAWVPAHAERYCLGSSLATLPAGGPATGTAHGLPLRIGRWAFAGPFGVWQDLPQAPNAPDGWVGDIVERTGTDASLGYPGHACTTEDGAGTYAYAVCHPYLYGAVQNPQGYGPGTPAASAGEWVGQCSGVAGPIQLWVEDGVLNTQILVLTNLFPEVDQVNPSPGVVPYGPGAVGPITLATACSALPGYEGIAFAHDGVEVVETFVDTIAVRIAVDVGAQTVEDLDVHPPP